MCHAYLSQDLLEKQSAGIPLTGPEARKMVADLQCYIKFTTKDATLEILLLGMVGSRYYEFVWDVLITESAANEQDSSS